VTQAVTMGQVRTANGRSTRLTRGRIVAAVVELLESGGVDAVTTRAIGESLQVHPTALYRHFRDMDELVREAADHILEGLAKEHPHDAGREPFDVLFELCQGLRTALMSHPGAAGGVASGPSRMPHERALTERMLELLSKTGLSDEDVVLGYHAVIEYTVGSAAIDAPGKGTDPDEESRHRAWRADYLSASPEDFPVTVRLAPLMYPTQDIQFQYGLRALVDGLRNKLDSAPDA
jgi:TetR/AcrR family transcriptional regulator, tetracycline repressor protein